MLRALLVAAAALLASTAAAQKPPPSAAPRTPALPAHGTPAPAPPAPAAAPQPAAPGGRNAKALDKAKSLGRLGLEKAAPKLGPAEKLVRRKGGTVVDQAVDLAAEKAGLVPVQPVR